MANAAILLLLSCAALAWGLFGAKRYVLFGEAIEIFYTLRSNRIEWKEVAFIEFGKVEISLSTGIPFVGIPIENQIMTIRLENGKEFNVDIRPLDIPAISSMIEKNVVFDYEREDKRRAKLALAEYKQQFLLRAIAAFGILMGCAVLLVLMREELMVGTQSPTWPVAIGRMDSSTIETEESGGRRGSKYTYFVPRVRYSYTVDGKAYSGERLAYFPARTEDRQEAAAVLAHFASSPNLEVFYKPNDPSVSVLLPGLTQDRYWLAGAGAVAGLISLIYGCLKLLAYRRNRHLQIGE